MNLARLVEQGRFLLPVLAEPGTVVEAPFSARDYRTLEGRGASTVTELYRRVYPHGLRRGERLGVPEHAVLGIARWARPFVDQGGAIAFGAGQAHYTAAGVSSATSSITAFSSGTDRCLIVGSATDRSGAGTVINSITYAGTGLTLQTAATGPNTEKLRPGTLVAPATGTNNLVTTYSSPNTHMAHTWLAYTGVDQTTPIDTATLTYVSGTGNGIASFTFSSAAGNLMVAFCAHLVSGITVTPGSGTTIRTSAVDGGAGNWGRMVAGERAGGAATVGWTTNGNPPSYGVGVELNASAAAAGGKPHFHYAQMRGGAA